MIRHDERKDGLSSDILSEVKRYLRVSIKCFKTKCYEEAVAQCDLLLQLDPNSLEAYRVRGMALIALKNYEEAISCYKRALQVNQNLANLYIDMAVALHNLGRYEEAVASCELAIQLDSNYIRAYYRKAFSLSYLKKNELVISVCEQAVLLRPQVLKTYLLYGRALSELKRYDEALKVYRRALAIPTSEVVMSKAITHAKLETLIAQGEDLFSSKHYEQAGAVYREAVLMNHRVESTYLEKVKALIAQGNSFRDAKRYDEAFEKYDAAVRFQRNIHCTECNLLFCELGETLISVAEVFFRLGREQEVQGIYEQVREDYKHDKQIYLTISAPLIQNAKRLYDMGHYQAACLAYWQTLLFHPKFSYKVDYKVRSVQLLHKSIDIYSRGQCKEAEGLFVQAIQFNPDVRSFITEEKDLVHRVQRLWSHDVPGSLAALIYEEKVRISKQEREHYDWWRRENELGEKEDRERGEVRDEHEQFGRKVDYSPPNIDGSDGYSDYGSYYNDHY